MRKKEKERDREIERKRKKRIETIRFGESEGKWKPGKCDAFRAQLRTVLLFRKVKRKM